MQPALPTFDPSQEQALAVFSHAAEEIRFFKGQQWNVTNYTLAAYAALVATASLVWPDCWRSWVSIAPAHAWMRLRYTANGNPVDYRVRLTSTRPSFGGLRWWFLCPLARIDGDPPRRVAKLYLPPGQIYFGSREAHGLTYTSCQESHDRLFRRIAAELGTSEAIVRWALKGPGGLLS